MKMKKWVKCLLMTMALMMAINVGAIATTIPATAKAKTETVKKGTKFWKGNLQYKVSSLKGKKGTATLIGAKSKVTSVSVPKTVKTGKYTLTVTAIGDNAFKGCKKLKKVATNTVIKEIGKNAFKGCKKLETVDIRSKSLKSVGKNALKGIAKTAVVKVPEGKDASYEKLLKVPVQTPAEEKATEAVKEAEAPKTPATEAPKAVSTPAETKTETPKAAETPEATPAPAGTKTETPKAAETPEATPTPEEPETKVQKATEAETEKATQKAIEVETQKETEKVTEAETQKATETEAPKALETTPTPAPTPSPEVKEPQTVPGIPEGPSFDEPAEPELKEAEPVTCGAKHLGLVVVESVAPTCTEPGSSSYEYCTVCGYKTEPIPISALGHELVHHAEIPATCTTAGQTAYDTCARCDYATASQTIEPLGHSYGDWAVVEEATCTASGTEEKTCATCGAKETRPVAAKGHTLGEATIEPIPGSAYYGRVVRRCTSCDYVEKSNYSVHRTDVYLPLEDIPATCTQPGRINRSYCPHCNEERFSYVKPLGHKYSDERTYEEGTCVKAGISYRKCVREGCNARIDVQETVKAEGHQWEDYTVAATCTQPGFEGRKCKLCGELDGEEKGALGHKYETTITEATCLTNGTKKDVCSVCGDTKVETLAAVGEHQWVEHPAKEATCVEDGHSAYTQCSVCGAYKDNVVPETYAANGQHTWVPDVALCNFMSTYDFSEDQCDCEGSDWNDVFKECKDCSRRMIDEIPQGHDWDHDSCWYVRDAKKATSNDEYGEMSGHILSASFLVNKDEVSGWTPPQDSANVDVCEIRKGKTTYTCVDIRRRAEGLFLKRTDDIKLPEGYIWVLVTSSDNNGFVAGNGCVDAKTPFYMADHCIFVAVKDGVKRDPIGPAKGADSGKGSQTETNTESETITDNEADLTEPAPNMEAVAADAEGTPQVIHGEMHVDLFGTTTPTVDDPGHEAHDVTHHEDPLVEPESTMSQGTELAG